MVASVFVPWYHYPQHLQQMHQTQQQTAHPPHRAVTVAVAVAVVVVAVLKVPNPVPAPVVRKSTSVLEADVTPASGVEGLASVIVVGCRNTAAWHGSVRKGHEPP
eukprot:m.118102 g.118102  ORF g.118102 m.118102 type:complete len:105 (+) comp16419_c1_seq3:2037-2351(+)